MRSVVHDTGHSRSFDTGKIRLPWLSNLAVRVFHAGKKKNDPHIAVDSAPVYPEDRKVTLCAGDVNSPDDPDAS